MIFFSRKKGNFLEIGAAVTLSHLAANENPPKPLLDSIKREASLNIRNIGTIAGHLVVCDGRSTFATALLAMDAQLKMETAVGENHLLTISLGDFLPQRNQKRMDS